MSQPWRAGAHDAEARAPTPVMDATAPEALIPRSRDKTIVEAKMSWTVRSAAVSAQGPRPTMEDRHTLIDDGWIDEERRQRWPNSATWPRCAFYGCFDGHGGDRAAELASVLLWKKLQSQLLMHMQSQGNDGTRAAAGGLVDQAASSFAGLFGSLLNVGAAGADAAWLETAVRRAFAQTEDTVVTHAVNKQWRDGCTAVAALLLGEYMVIANLGDSRVILATAGTVVGSLRTPATWRVTGTLLAHRARPPRMTLAIVPVHARCGYLRTTSRRRPKNARASRKRAGASSR